MLVLSDFYDDEERTLAELRRAARMGHEVVLFQILSRDEIELPYRRDLEFADLESGRTLAVNAGLARRDYKDAVAAFLERWHSRAGAEGFQYSLIVTDTPPERALRNFLLARHAVRRAMIWLNPLALFALAAVAAPILIHILVQRRAERFAVSDAAVPAADAAGRDPASRARGSAAARGPRGAAGGRGRGAGRSAVRHDGATAGVGSAHRARNVVVDDVRGGASPPRDRKRREQAGQRRRPTEKTFEAVSLADGIRRAVLWLDAAPPARREIVIASPFPIGSLTEADIAADPAGHRRAVRADRHAAGDADRAGGRRADAGGRARA